MQGKSDLIHIKRKTLLFLFIAFLVLGIVTPVFAGYLGPDRTTITSEVDTYDYGVWARDNNTIPYCLDKKGNKADDCIVCEWKRKPGNACGNATYWYTLGTISEVVETTVSLPPATISSSLQNCSLNNGWCNTASELSLNGTEPLSGYNILAIEGSLNGQPFACSGSNCNVSLNEGNNDLSFWALSSYGDSSTMGTNSAKVDTVSPSVGLDLSGSSGTNGWFVSLTTITATGSDATSGLLSALLSVNSGPWESSSILSEGVHNISVQAEDNAGNTANSSTTISVDTITPTIDVSVNGTLDSNGWYSTSMQVTATANDATSGVASLESSLDGGVYQAYISPVSFADGYHTIQFKAVDKAGNETETSVQEFYVDAFAPAIDLPAEWEVNDTITYKVQDEGSGLAALRIVIEDEDEKFAKVAWDEVVSRNKFKGEITWDGKFKDGIIAPPGEYLVWVKVTDVAGNEHIGLGRVVVPQPFASFSLIQSSKASTEIPTPPADLFDSEDSSQAPENPNADPSTSPSTSFGGSPSQTNSTTVQSLTLTSGSSSASSTAPSNVLWGAAAAAMLGAATAYALEEQRKRKEAEARLQEDGTARKRANTASHRADRDEEPPLTRHEKELAKKRKELQKIWNANGAAIYEANREYKAKHGKEMDAASRSKAIKDATMNGVFHAKAYVSNLEAEKARQDARNERMANQMTRFEKEEEARWQAQQKAAEEKRKAEELRAGYATYYAAMRQGEQARVEQSRNEVQTNWWDKAIDFVEENIVEPVQKAITTGTAATSREDVPASHAPHLAKLAPKPLVVKNENDECPWWKVWDTNWSWQCVKDAWNIFWDSGERPSPTPDVSAVQTQAVQTFIAPFTQTAQAVRTPTPTPTSTSIPVLPNYQIYKSTGTLTSWETTVGGEVAHNAHLLLADASHYYFWSNDDPGGNSNPPLPPGYDLKFPISTNISPEISRYTNGRIPFVCGDVPDLAYYLTGYNLQQLIFQPNPINPSEPLYPNRWPRSSYGYLTMLYQQGNHHIYSVENNGGFDVLPELGDVIVTQTDNDPLATFNPVTGESPAGHVVLVAEIHGSTPDQIIIIEGNPDDGTLVQHTVQELIDRMPDLQYLIYGHPDLPIGAP